MGARGPAPKPTALRKMEGNPSRRPFPANEPQYSPGIPDRPKKMNRGSRVFWDELVNEMAGMGVLTRVDKRALWQLAEDEHLLSEAYAGIWQMVAAIEQKAKADGTKLPAGAIFQMLNMTNGRLAMTAIRHLATRVIIQRREFGLTPSSRCRIEGSPEWGGGAVDPLEMKLCG